MLTFEEYLIKEMPLPSDWDQKVFTLPGRFTLKDFRHALVYAKQKAALVGKGSSRAVFKLEYEGRPTILKMAMNKAGLAQNEREASVIFDGVMKHSRIIIPGIDYDEQNDQPLWIHQEYAQPVENIDFIKTVGGAGLDTLIRHMRNLNGNPAYRPWNIPDDFKKDHELVHELHELWGNLGFESEFIGDLGAPEQWGKYQGRLVIVDLGISSDVYQHHYYGKRNGPKSPGGLGRVQKS